MPVERKKYLLKVNGQEEVFDITEFDKLEARLKNYTDSGFISVINRVDEVSDPYKGTPWKRPGGA